MRQRTRQHSYIRRFVPLLVVVLLTTLAIGMLQAQLLPVFRIGVLDEPDGPLTRGAQLAVQQINEAGGVLGADGTSFQLQLVVQSPSDMELAVANINQSSVIAVIGPAVSDMVLGNRELLATLDVPILTAATEDTIIANDLTNRLIRIRAQDSLQGRALAEYLINDLNAASLATVQLDLGSTVSVIGFTQAAAQRGLAPTSEYILAEDTSLEEIILDIAAEMPQVVVAYGPPEVTAQLYTGLREADWAGRFAYNQASSLAFREKVQESLLEGIISVSTWSYTYNDAPSQSFVLSFVRAFGTVPGAVDAAGYDAVYLLQEAIAQPGNLLNNLLSIEEFQGVQGVLRPARLTPGETSTNVSITELGEFGAPLAVARFLDGERQPLEDTPVVAAEPSQTPTPRPTATPDGVYLVITRPVQNVRSGPGLNYDIIGQLQDGDQAQVIGATVDFGWVAINFRGTTGWLSRPILDLLGDTNTVPILTPPPSPTPLPATATPTVPPIPDIVIVSAAPTRLTVGTPFSVTVTVRNQGGTNAGPFAVAATFEPGSAFSAVNLPGLAANTDTVVTLTGVLTGGTGTQNVTIVADLNNQVNEGAGEGNNSDFILTYIADAPLLTTAQAIGTITLNDLGTATLDASGEDIQWGGGGIVPLGATQLGVLNGFSSFENVHRDAVANATLQNLAITTVSPGMLIGILTDTGGKYGVLQIISAQPGGQLIFNYRMYDN